MILINIAVLAFITGLNFIILGKILKKKKILIIGICIFLLLALSIFLFVIYAIEKENMLAESQRIGQVDDNTILPTPDRIIYKNANQKYTIIDANTSAFSTIYSELYNRLTSTYDGKVFSEDEISQMQNIGNIKYEFGNLKPNYTVNLLIISKVVNSNCIYYNVSENDTNTELSDIITITTSATIKNMNENRIEIGLGNENSTHIVELQNNTLIKNYETGQEISITDLKGGSVKTVEYIAD